MGEASPQIENPKSKIQNPPPPWYRKAVTAALVVYWIALFTATHLPKIPKPLEFDVSDKSEHYVAYAILGLLLAAWRSTRGPVTPGVAVRLWGMMCAYAAFEEVTQPLVGRTADLRDFGADMVGAATGLALYALIAGLRSFARRRRKQN